MSDRNAQVIIQFCSNVNTYIRAEQITIKQIYAVFAMRQVGAASNTDEETDGAFRIVPELGEGVELMGIKMSSSSMRHIVNGSLAGMGRDESINRPQGNRRSDVETICSEQIRGRSVLEIRFKQHFPGQGQSDPGLKMVPVTENLGIEAKGEKANQYCQYPFHTPIFYKYTGFPPTNT